MYERRFIMDAVKKAKEVMGSPDAMLMQWTRFRSCQAWTGMCMGYTFIKSYQTIVAIIDHDERKLYELGKYSQTTSKQVTQIHNSMFRGYDRELVGRISA
jgi:hypothetical protein